MEPSAGVEPATCSVPWRCSTELRWHGVVSAPSGIRTRTVRSLSALPPTELGYRGMLPQVLVRTGRPARSLRRLSPPARRELREQESNLRLYRDPKSRRPCQQSTPERLSGRRAPTRLLRFGRPTCPPSSPRPHGISLRRPYGARTRNLLAENQVSCQLAPTAHGAGGDRGRAPTIAANVPSPRTRTESSGTSLPCATSYARRASVRGEEGTRTPNLRPAGPLLCQLSYNPMVRDRGVEPRVSRSQSERVSRLPRPGGVAPRPARAGAGRGSCLCHPLWS